MTTSTQTQAVISKFKVSMIKECNGDNNFLLLSRVTEDSEGFVNSKTHGCFFSKEACQRLNLIKDLVVELKNPKFGEQLNEVTAEVYKTVEFDGLRIARQS